jgi:hypothetical protein
MLSINLAAVLLVQVFYLLSLGSGAPNHANVEAKQISFPFKNEHDKESKIAVLQKIASMGASSQQIDELLQDPEKLEAMSKELEPKFVPEYVIHDKVVNDGSIDFLRHEVQDGVEASAIVLETGSLEMSEEDALGLSHMCRIHTFAPDTLLPETRQLLSLWLRNWYSLGLRPKILRRSDASIFMMEFMPPSYGADLQWYETDAFVRWMTLFAHGGGVMTDYDLFGMSHDMPLVDSQQCYALPPKPNSHAEHLGGIVMGTRLAINKYAQSLLQIGHEETEARRALGQKLLINDKLLAKKHTERLFSHLFKFPGLMALTPARILEESRALGVDLKRSEWVNDLLKVNFLNRNRLEIVVPQDTVLKAHPIRALLDSIKCPALDGQNGWKPVMPSALADIETVLPIPEANCHIGFHFEGSSHYTDLKSIESVRTRRPKKENEPNQKRKLVLVLEDPVTSAWNRIGAKRPLSRPNPISRFFFGENSPLLNPETFDFQNFNQECASLFGKLESQDNMLVILLDQEHTGQNGKTTRLALEYGLGFTLSTSNSHHAEKKAMSLKMDRSWKARFEDENQADAIFYVIARAHFERRANQAEFIERQLKASTTEMEKTMTKLEL